MNMNICCAAKTNSAHLVCHLCNGCIAHSFTMLAHANDGHILGRTVRDWEKITPTGGGDPVGVICNDRRFGRRRIASPIGPYAGRRSARPEFNVLGLSRGQFHFRYGVPVRSNQRDQNRFSQSLHLHIMKSRRDCAVQYQNGWHAILAWLRSDRFKSTHSNLIKS